MTIQKKVTGKSIGVLYLIKKERRSLLPVTLPLVVNFLLIFEVEVFRKQTLRVKVLSLFLLPYLKIVLLSVKTCSLKKRQLYMKLTTQRYA